MITFLSSPKAFVGRNAQNQVRAIRSWLSVAEGVEVILYGHADGAMDVCRALGIEYVPDIESTPSGIPYFNAIVEHAEANGAHDIQVYLNCDILLNHSLAHAVDHIDLTQYLLIGQRVDLADGLIVDPTSTGWLHVIQYEAARQRVRLHAPTGKDYFVFTRGLWEGLSPVVIGRGGYDSALLAHCLSLQIPIIDGTFNVVALHQFHDYTHVPGGLDEIMQGELAMQNRLNHQIRFSAPTVADAHYVLIGDHLVPNKARGDRLRALELQHRFVQGRQTMGLLTRLLWRFSVAAGILAVPTVTLSDVVDAWSGWYTDSCVKE